MDARKIEICGDMVIYGEEVIGFLSEDWKEFRYDSCPMSIIGYFWDRGYSFMPLRGDSRIISEEELEMSLRRREAEISFHRDLDEWFED